MRSSLLSIALLTVVAAAVPLAACGDAPGLPKVPTVPSVPTGPGTTAPTASSPSTGTAPAGTGTGTAATPAGKGPMKAMTGSAMAADLKALGLDPKALPPLNKIPPDKIRPLMMTFKKALGTECTSCHDAGNFKAPTPNKKIASKMWDEFVRKLAMEKADEVLYCDSCHQGSMQFLDRHDKKALSAWMDANFVSKAKRVDKKDHSCETCHGDPFEPKFIAGWSK